MLLTAYLAEAAKKHANPVPALVLSVIAAISESFLMALAGYFFARRGILDDRAKKTLNKLNVSLFTPSLLFTGVAFNLSPDKLAELYIVPLGFVIITTFSAGMAWLVGTTFRLKPQQRNFAIACAMFQNSNSLPIALMQSLISEHMPLKWTEDDNKDSMLGRALTYLVLFSTLGIIVRWSVGVKLLSKAEADPEEAGHDLEGDVGAEDDEDHTYVDDGDEDAPLLSANGRDRTRSNEVSFDTPTLTINGSGSADAVKRSRRKPVFQSFPNTPVASTRASSVRTSAAGSDDSDDDDDSDEFGGRRPLREQDGPETRWGERWTRFKKRAKRATARPRRWARAFGQFMTVPLWAAVISLFIACVPPLQATLARVTPVRAAIQNAGRCSVPVTLITLGAYFYTPTEPTSTSQLESVDDVPPPKRKGLALLWPFQPRSKYPRQRRDEGAGDRRTILVAILSRMILVPLVLVPLFGFYAIKTRNVADDPIFVVAGILLIGSPPAITLAQITSSASGATFERLVSKTMLVAYAFMTAPTTICLVLAGLFILSKDKPDVPPLTL